MKKKPNELNPGDWLLINEEQYLLLAIMNRTVYCAKRSHFDPLECKPGYQFSLPEYEVIGETTVKTPKEKL